MNYGCFFSIEIVRRILRQVANFVIDLSHVRCADGRRDKAEIQLGMKDDEVCYRTGRYR